jgi:putative ABC transport system permease protein
MSQFVFFRTYLKREIFNRKTFALQVILSVAIGVGAVTGIQSYKTSLIGLIRAEAKNLMGADLAFQTPEKPRNFQYDLLKETLPKGSETAEVVQFLSMIRNEKNAEVGLSMIRAMDVGYPFYGSIESDPVGAFRNLEPGQILLDPGLVQNLGLKPGDPVRLGETSFRYSGSIVREPGSVGGFTGMAPTAILRKESLAETGLEERGSRIRYSIYAKLPVETDTLVFKKRFFQKYSENDLTIFHNTEANSGSQMFITNTLDYLSLLGLASFFLGAIAIFISSRTRVLNTQKQISILKCLGVRSAKIRSLVLLETLSLSLMGSVLGLLLGYWIQSSLPNLLAGQGLPEMEIGLTNVALLEGIGLGFLIPILVSIHSLAKAGMVSPMSALKNPEGLSNEEIGTGSRFGKLEYLLLILVYLVFFGIAWLDTGSILKGLVLCSIFCLLPALIWFLYLVLRFALAQVWKRVKFSKDFSLVFRKFVRQYGLVSLSIVGLGSAIFVLFLSLILRESLLNLGGARQLTKRPNVFVLDIREEQKKEFERKVLSYKPDEFRIVPVTGARLSKINGKPIDKSSVEEDAMQRDWRATARTREYMLSYRDELFDTEEVTKGRFWSKESRNEISIEKDFSKYLGAGVGDELEFMVYGVPIRGKITNLRSVNWSDMKPNFVVLFSRGDLEAAPRFYLSSFYIENDRERYQLQKEIITSSPNITFIDTEKAVKSFEKIIEKVSGIINIMSALLVFSAILLLVSVLYSSARERARELVLYRVVGAKKHFIRRLVLREAMFLSLFSLVTSLGLALGSDWILNRFVLELESVYPYTGLGLVSLSVILFVSIAYYATTRKLFELPIKKLLQSN